MQHKNLSTIALSLISAITFCSAGASAQSINLATADGGNAVVFSGANADEFLGNAELSGVGDFDGDGIDDIVIGTRGAINFEPDDPAGRVFVLYGSTATQPRDFDLAALANGDGSLGFVINGVDPDDRAGASVSRAGDLNGDGLMDIVIGAREAEDPAIFGSSHGEAYVVYGFSGRTASSIELATLSAGDGSSGFAIVGAQSGDLAGAAVRGAGDFNADGIDDIIVGMPGSYGNADNTLNRSAGSAFVIFGPGSASTVAKVNLADIEVGDDSTGVVFYGVDFGDRTGEFVDSAGDFNGDGIADIIIGTAGASENLDDQNHAFVVFGNSNVASMNLLGAVADKGFRIAGTFAGNGGGANMEVAGVGDFNGDGLDDVVVTHAYAGGGVNADGSGFSGNGAAYVVFGRSDNSVGSVSFAAIASDPTIGMEIATAARSGTSRVGRSLAAAGDFNGDELADLILGADLADIFVNDSGVVQIRDDAGLAYVVYGSTTPDVSSIVLDQLEADGAGLYILGAAEGDIAGRHVGGAGDFNGDGVDDVLVAASGAQKAYLIFGSANTAPYVSFLAARTVVANQSSAEIPITVNDAETSADALVTNVTSSDLAVVGTSGISLSGAGGDRFLTLAPVTNAVGETVITVTVDDADGAQSTSSFILTVVDVIAPVITLRGGSTLDVNVGESFVDPGATALDDIDGDLTSSISIDAGANDTTTTGSFLVSYSVSDAAGNDSAIVIRTVNVVEPPPVPSPAAPPSSGGGGGAPGTLSLLFLLSALVMRRRSSQINAVS